MVGGTDVHSDLAEVGYRVGKEARFGNAVAGVCDPGMCVVGGKDAHSDLAEVGYRGNAKKVASAF